MRVNQFVAAGSGLSRRAADTAIAAGRVLVNGEAAGLGQPIALADTVTLDGTPLTLPANHTYIMLNKPAGYVSSRVRQGSGPTLYDLLPATHHHLRIAGRLDRDSSGLIILTDDGAYIQQLTHPGAGKSKHYELKLARPLAAPDAAALERGVMLGDGLSRVKILNHRGRHVTVSLSEGRNRQLRRTFGALGYTVERLHRTKLGPFDLHDLPPGKWIKTDHADHFEEPHP
ncbi:MAG TPA: pseudouridine synthase [Candidatus Saccharimonadia bacterium]|nr:pseudouridine synthase [Candidatus Saccharimonadia bacterium]